MMLFAQLPPITPSAFVPVVLGFFGLSACYFIWGGQALFGYPKPTIEVNRTMGLWGIWMGGFMQFITGVYIIVGLTWFHVFTEKALYMAGLAFPAYGVHWFALGHRRFSGYSAAPDAWMAIAFLLLSILGMLSFIAANDIPVTIVFVLLSLVYLTEALTQFGVFEGARLVGLWQFLNAIWLMYLVFAVTLKLIAGVNIQVL